MTTNTKRNPVPWLAVTTVALQFTAVILVTLLLVCPTPWQHGSISLFTIQPLQLAPTATPAPIASSIANATKSSTTSSTSSSSISSSTDSSIVPLPTANVSLDDQNAAQDAVNSSRSGLSTRSLHRREATPLDGLGSNATTAPPQSDIRFRIGPLGSCFRSADGQEACTPASLTHPFDYAALQRDIDATYRASDANDTTTDTTGTRLMLAASLPEQMSTYATVLLVLIVVMACVSLAGILHIVTVVMLAPFVDPSGPPPSTVARMARETPWLSLLGLAKWLALASGLTIVVASGTMKYKLSNGKNAFNTASPSVLANGHAESARITLEADTGSGFGYAWLATAGWLISFWLQRVFLRRYAALQKAREELRGQRQMEAGVYAAGDGGLVMTMDDAKPSTSTMNLAPPPSYSGGPASDAKRAFAALYGGMQANEAQQPPRAPHPRVLHHATSLPSLLVANEAVARSYDAADSPPFSRYQHDIGSGPAAASQQHVGSPLARSAYTPPAALHAAPIVVRPVAATTRTGHGRQTSRIRYHPAGMEAKPTSHTQRQRHDREGAEVLTDAEEGDDGATAASGRAASLRSPSPAPSYWTANGTEWTPQEKERERQYMAELRRQRSAQ